MSGLINISEAAVLALHAMIFIAEKSNPMVSTKEIAAAHKASEAHLAKVMQRLAKAGFVSSIRGPKGGFRLAKEPENITLMELYELFEGTVQENSCLFDYPVCGRDKCVFGDNIKNINALTIRFLSDTRLSDVVSKPTEK